MSKRITVLLAATVLFAACDDTAGPGDAMTRAEALLVADALAANGEATSEASQPETGEVTIASVPTTFTQTHNSLHPCPMGGRLALAYTVTGAFDGQVGSWEVNLVGKQTHQGCAYGHEGVTITVDGNPSINFESRAAVYNGTPSEPHTMGIDGGFKWSGSDGRAGNCMIEISAVTDFAAKRKTVNGTVCGHTIEQITTWT